MSTPHIDKQPALLISYNGEKISKITPVLVPEDWDYNYETLPFTIGSNQIVTTEMLIVSPSSKITYSRNGKQVSCNT